jgi:hypothetical protein
MESSDVIRGDVAAVMQELQLAVSQDQKSRAYSEPNDTLRIEHAYTSGWVIAVCIIFFPLGLLALLAPKKLDLGTVAVSDHGDGTVLVRMAGAFHLPSHNAIRTVIDRHRRDGVRPPSVPVETEGPDSGPISS